MLTLALILCLTYMLKESKNMKKLFPLIVVLMFSACASLPVVSSTYLTNEPSSLKYHYDIENNIAYKVTHDDDYLYLELKTDDKTSIMKIAKQGLYIYIDPRGHKSKEIFFNYPLDRKFNQSEMKNGMRPQMGSREEFNVHEAFEKISMEALYSKYGEAEKFPVYSNSSGFNVELNTSDKSVLIYKLRIPFDEIQSGGLKNLDDLSLGIETAIFEMPSMNAHSGGGMDGGSGRPSGMGMQGGRDGSQMNSDMQGPGGNREAMMKQISIWFSVDLNDDQIK